MGAMVGGLQAAGRLDEFDLLIEVPRSTCRGLEFHRAVEVIAAGRALAFDALEAGPDRTASPAIDG
jgi:NTE family protein